MAMQTLTTRSIEALTARATRYEVYDALTPGLTMRVGPSGHKSFTLVYKHHGRNRRLALGRFPDVSLADARKAAIQQRGRIVNGADPAGEKRAEHAQNTNTVQALYNLYRAHKEKTLKSWSEVRRIMEREVLPTWQHRRVVDLRRRDVRELIEYKARTSPTSSMRRSMESVGSWNGKDCCACRAGIPHRNAMNRVAMSEERAILTSDLHGRAKCITLSDNDRRETRGDLRSCEG